MLLEVSGSVGTIGAAIGIAVAVIGAAFGIGQIGKAAVDGIYWCLYFQCERLADEKSIISCRAGRYRKVTA